MIGVFDSGSGGLTVLRALRERAPKVDIVYFGDIKNAPYGVRSAEELRIFTEQATALLKARGADELVFACNSVSAQVLAGAAGETPYVEMSRPTARFLREHYAGKRFLLIATPATVASRLFDDAIGDAALLDSLAIPELAGAIEFGHSATDIGLIVRAAFRAREGEHYDGLVLGCTHYPLERTSIEAVAAEYFGDLHIVDPAEPVAEEAVARFLTAGEGKTLFLLSQDSPTFRARVEDLFPQNDYTVEVL